MVYDTIRADSPVTYNQIGGDMRIRNTIPFGNYICILGAGQLGKMTALAAEEMGYRTIIWAPEGDNPAMEVATVKLEVPFSDTKTFSYVAKTASVITTEWENIPIELIRSLERANALVRPSSEALIVAQSRNMEKNYAKLLGANPVHWYFIPHQYEVIGPEDVEYFLPGILKSDRMGYDGKGQISVNDFHEYKQAQKELDCDCVLEKKISLDSEFSVLVARNFNGEIAVSPVVKNDHINGILNRTVWSKGCVTESVEREIVKIAIDFATKLNLEGVLAIEFFVARDGVLYFNEIAPRPHNSFHGSIDASLVSQFDQHVQAICNLPLKEIYFHNDFIMENIIGRQITKYDNLTNRPKSKIHIYGKKEIREGRKMGHITTLLD